MDIISKAGFLTLNWDLTHKVFSDGLGFATMVHNKTFSKYEIESHGQIITSVLNEFYDQKPASIDLIVSREKVAKVAKILKEASEKQNFVFSENVGEGILSTLVWAIGNGSMLHLESFEDNYWEA